MIIRERLQGKWQIPLLGMSLALMGTGLWTAIPHVPVKTLPERIAELNALVDDGAYHAAIRVSRELLGSDEDRPANARESAEPGGSGGGTHGEPSPSSGGGGGGGNAKDNHSPVDRERAPVHLALARSLCLQAQRDGLKDPTAGELSIHHFEKAAEGGVELTPEDEILMGRAHEWIGDIRLAVTSYATGAARSPDPHLDVRRRALELMRVPLQLDANAISPALDEFIKLSMEDIDALAWGVEYKAELLLSENRAAELPDFLNQVRSRFAGTSSADLITYLDAWTAAKLGRVDEAELILRDLRNRLPVSNDLTLRAGWLLGQLLKGADGPGRPQEALSFFQDVLTLRPKGRYEAATHLGLAEALYMLQRYPESVLHYQKARELIGQIPPSVVISEDQVRSSLATAMEQLRAAGQLEDSVPFATELVELVQKVQPLTSGLLSEAQRHRASEIRATVLWQAAELFAQLGGSDPTAALLIQGQESTAAPASRGKQTQYLRRAGELYEELSRLAIYTPERAALAGWRAAELFDEAGDLEKSVELLKTFIVQFPDSEFTPRALLRLGLSLQALQRFEEAAAIHQENIQRFPRTPGAMSAMIPLAQCYMAMGQDSYGLAEQTLMGIVEDSTVFTPQAGIYADALFLLGELQSRSGQVERAIPTLEEVLARFPHDARAPRSTFLLADAYRRSGSAILDKLQEVLLAGEREQLRDELNRRLVRAADLFGALVQQREAGGNSDPGDTGKAVSEALAALDELYLEHARLYQADCLYHLQRYPEALALYESTAWIYKDSPSALSAYVQIINCYLFMSEPDEAQAALARALYLVDRIPDDRFGNDPMSGNREEWRQYFQWVEQTGLF